MFRVVVLGCVLVCACGKREPSANQEAKAPARPTAGDLVRPGTVKLDHVESVIGVAIPKGGDVAAAETLARERGAAAKLEIERTTVAAFGFDHAWIEMASTKITDADVEGIEQAAAVIVVRGRGTDGIAVLRAVAADASAVADATHGWVLDPGVSGAYTADVFRERVPGVEPDIRKLIVVHAVGGDGDLPFLDTMGMRRLGLPDLYVATAGRGQIERYTTMINLVAQTMLDEGDVTRMGEISIDIAKLHADWHLADVRKQGGAGTATFRAHWSKGSGDHGAEGELSIELVPPGGPTPEAAEAVFDACLGHEPEKLTYVKDDDPELLAAGKRARTELAKLCAVFKKGVPVDQFLSVKARFADDGEVEWMWVDVVRFSGTAADGTLANTPEVVTNVKAGQRVKVKLADIADYVHTKADGSQVGGYSVEVFRKRGLIE